MKNETRAGRGNVRPSREATDPDSTGRRAQRLASRLWPRRDAVSYARRQVVPTVAAADVALRTAIELRARVDEHLFRDLVRLHIYPTRVESLLALVVANLNVAVRRFEDALGLMESARSENMVREYDRRSMERDRA